MNALALIHIARTQLGLDDDTYRAVLVRVTGKPSAGDMTEAERQKVLGAFRQQGFTGQKRRLEGPFARKLQALWIAAHNLGLVRDRTDAAMLAFVRRQTGIEDTRFLRSAADARRAIEALKGWIARDGGVDWTRAHGRDWLVSEPAKIAWAQFGKIVPGATLMGNERMFAELAGQMLGQGAVHLAALTALQWQAVMNELGKRIRKASR